MGPLRLIEVNFFVSGLIWKFLLLISPGSGRIYIRDHVFQWVVVDFMAGSMKDANAVSFWNIVASQVLPLDYHGIHYSNSSHRIFSNLFIYLLRFNESFFLQNTVFYINFIRVCNYTTIDF